MREPDWMLASVVVLGFIALVLACVYESTYDARHCASDDARRAGVGLWHLSCLISAYMVLHISMPQLVEEVPRPLRNVMDSVALTSVFAGALALVRFKEETFDDMPPSIRDDILSHFFISDAEIVEIEAEKEQNETSIERSRVELEMEAKATLAKFNNRAPKRTSGTEKTNA